MANTLTNLIPDIYSALDVVSRELVGFIPAVARDSSADRVAANQNLRIPISPANAAGADITPAMSLPSASDQTISNSTLTITKQRYFPFSWTGEEAKSVDYGPGFLTLKQYQIAQAIRAAVNEVEVDIATAAKNSASRGYGTAGTTPFGTAADMTDLSNVYKILDDNGAPKSDRHLIINTAASANLRGKQSQLFKVNESGTDALLRRGEIGNLMGFGLHESAQVQSTTAGTGASYLLNGALSVGATTVTVDTGSGTILAGDIVTIGSHKYVVATALSGGSFTINAPGIQAAAADNLAITVSGTSARNIAHSRNSILLATRLPAIPEEGDQASDRTVVTDPNSGLSFEFAVYPGYRMNVYHVSLAWGVKVIKPEHVAVLLG